MPTTRFASSTVSTDSSSSNGKSSTTAEFYEEQRQESFDNRQIREAPNDASQKQKIMIQFIDHVTDVDTNHLLWSKLAEGSVTFETVIERVYKLKYKDFASLKSDVDTVFSACVHSVKKSIPELDAFKKLYTYTSSLLSLEAARLEEKLEVNDNIIEFISLFRPTNDGYAFTDMIVKDPSVGPITNYPHNIHELIVHKAQPAAPNEVPPLKDVVAPPPNFHSKNTRHENKPIVSINWLDFGAFSSFAPASDSNNANATYESTYMGRSAKRFKKWEEKQIEKDSEESTAEEMETNDNDELNALWLEKEGFDVKAIEEAMSKKTDTVAQELERNCQLLEELVQYQQSRFSAGKTKWDAVEEKEVEIAKTLEKYMTDMLSKLPPNATTNSDVIESTMARLPLLDSSYRGTLPPHKIFSFPTTERAENLPPYANITPTYSKDNWRLVKVAPVPPKEMTGDFPVFPLVSMMEQQQLNFYQRPPFPGQPQQQQQALPSQPQQQQRAPIAAAGPTFAYQQHQRR